MIFVASAYAAAPFESGKGVYFGCARLHVGAAVAFNGVDFMIECIQTRDHVMAQKIGEAIDFTSSLWRKDGKLVGARRDDFVRATSAYSDAWTLRSEEHTSELQSRG